MKKINNLSFYSSDETPEYFLEEIKKLSCEFLESIEKIYFATDFSSSHFMNAMLITFTKFVLKYVEPENRGVMLDHIIWNLNNIIRDYKDDEDEDYEL